MDSTAPATGARRLTAAQRRFKKAIQYRKKHGVSLKAAFRAVKGGAEEEKEEAMEVAPAMGARRHRKTRKGGASSLSPLPVGGRRKTRKSRR
jgi:hypothetical protein